MENLTKNFENQNITQENNFNSIKITLASPEKIKSGLMEKLKSLKLLTIERLEKKMDYSALEFLGR